jgi:hypothetical protein
MKRLVLVLLAATSLLPSAASAAACSPLNCAASQFSLANGALLGFRTRVDAPVTVVDLQTGEAQWALPAGVVGGNLLVSTSSKGTALVWYDASRGTKIGHAPLPSGGTLVGVSQNGSRAVVEQPAIGGKTRFTIVSHLGRRDITIPGTQWDFDALRGDNLFLIRYLKAGGYQVRLVHVGSRRLQAAPLKDPHESGTIWGSPYARLPSADGRYLFTLYIGGNGGAMIHELDLKAAAKARCIDLPGTGDYGLATSWAMQLSKDGRTLWAVSPGYGRVVAIDVAERKVMSAFPVSFPGWSLGNGTASALSPDGGKIAVADDKTVAVVDLAARKVVQRDPARAIALGYAPDGRLWKLS